jgi:hypothetical protein
MKKSLTRYWYLAALWLLTLLFLFCGPKLAAAFGGKAGRPLDFAEPLPPPGDSITLYLDRAEKTAASLGADQRLTGWAFLGAEADQSNYDRYLVLLSADQSYVFSVENKERPDVQQSYHPTFTNLLDSGFTAPISTSLLPNGTYRVGLLFRNQQDGSLAFSLSTLTLEHTPNTFSLDNPAEEPVTRPRTADSPRVELTLPLPAPSGSVLAYLDGLTVLEQQEPTQYQLFGWAFLQDEPDQGQYERILVLQSAQTTIAFQVSPVQRPDVQQAYQDQPGNLVNSGFAVNFSNDALAPAEYTIGILFRQSSGGGQYYAPSNHRLVFREDAWHLEVNPAP